MSDLSLPKSSIQQFLDRLVAGDESARDDLMRCACDRLTKLTRRMLQDLRRVRRWEETDDVFQNSVLRLCAALQRVHPPTTLDFFRLAALHIRRELIDLARKYYGPEGLGHNLASNRSRSASGSRGNATDPAGSTWDPIDAAQWTEFHEHVSSLSDEDREMFDLLWYQGLTHAESAELLNVTERTIQRRWQSARVHLHRQLKQAPNAQSLLLRSPIPVLRRWSHSWKPVGVRVKP